MPAANKIIRLKEAARKRVQLRGQTKLELAKHAISALAELGYARTSMRDIAAQSGRSIGALNYYFEDKSDLISFCVTIYKEDFVRRIDEIVTSAVSREKLIDAFIEGLVTTVVNEAKTHRLWYDIRSQSLFDGEFHEVVAENEQALIEMIGRLLVRLDIADAGTQEAYYLIDGCFRIHLQQQLRGENDVSAGFRAELRLIFDGLIG